MSARGAMPSGAFVTRSSPPRDLPLSLAWAGAARRLDLSNTEHHERGSTLSSLAVAACSLYLYLSRHRCAYPPKLGFGARRARIIHAGFIGNLIATPQPLHRLDHCRLRCRRWRGIQADLKTFVSLGVHGCSAITALTAQNSREVRMVEYPSRAFLRTTLEALRDDLPAAAIKLGMLGSKDVIDEVAAFLANESNSCRNVAVVCDPVMVTTSGSRLLDDGATDSLVRTIFPRCAIVTPNLPEAEALLGGKALRTPADVEAAAAELLSAAMLC